MASFDFVQNILPEWLMRKPSPKDVVERLRMLRARAGLTQEELGVRAGRSTRWVINIENSEKLPSMEQLALLSRVYGIAVQDILAGPERAEPAPPRDGKLWLVDQAAFERIMSAESLKAIEDITGAPLANEHGDLTFKFTLGLPWAEGTTFVDWRRYMEMHREVNRQLAELLARSLTHKKK